MLVQDLFRLRPSNPHRPVNWRWLLAEYLQGGNVKPAACQIDDAVTVAAESLSETGESKSLKTAFTSRDALTAHEIWFENGWDRCLLECWILTGIPLKEVAKQLGISHETVQAYHDLFFDLQSRTKSSSFLTHAVIRLPASWEIPIDLETAFRAFAVHGGVHILRALMAAYQKEVETKYVLCDPGSHGLSPAELRRIRRGIKIFQTPVTKANALSWSENIADIYAAGKLANGRPKWNATSRQPRDKRPNSQSQHVGNKQVDESAIADDAQEAAISESATMEATREAEAVQKKRAAEAEFTEYLETIKVKAADKIAEHQQKSG